VHPDLHFSFPVIGTNVTSDHFLNQWRTQLLDNAYFDLNHWLQLIGAENKQGNINKGECLRIIQKLGLKTFESQRKVLIMWLPEFLGKEGNRLLKIIEEPPENTHFILVAENQDLILNTILSRCQLIKIPTLTDEEVKLGLMEKTNTGEAEAMRVALLAEGDFTLALQMLHQGESDNARLFLDWMRKCYRGNGVELVQWVESFATLGREKQKYFVKYALHFMREYLMLKMTNSDQVRLLEK
jgi:DNA polymerase-3 subunit delta'